MRRYRLVWHLGQVARQAVLAKIGHVRRCRVRVNFGGEHGRAAQSAQRDPEPANGGKQLDESPWEL